MDLINQLRYKAKLNNATIVLPESDDVRTLKAVSYLVEQKICKVILVGNGSDIQVAAGKEKLPLSTDVSYAEFNTDPHKDELIERLVEIRKHKGLTPEQAEQVLQNKLYYAALLVETGRADGCVAGAANTTGDVLRSAIQVIGLKPGSKTVSSVFLMHTQDEKVLTFGDCAVVPYPDAQQLATIAIDSAATHEALTGVDAYVAMLSFSTKGSAKHENIDTVLEGLKIAQQTQPDLNIDGELQFDAAYVQQVAQKKAPGSNVAGHANVYIFPNIDSGNIAYKISERLGGATAIGPIIQGLKKPMNDLSRGCHWEDIVNTAAVTILMAE